MQRNSVQFRRLLVLDEYIRNNRFPNCRGFAREWEVSRKTIQRDIEFLRDQLDAPIEYDREHRGYYYSDRNWFLPALKISEGDLVLLLIGTRALKQFSGTPVAAKLDRIFRKISESLPSRISICPETVFSAFSFTGPPSKPVDETIWIALVRGLLNHRSVDVHYRAFNCIRPDRRRIDPLHMANLQGEWYVFAYCHKRKSVRQFAIPRIDSAKLTTVDFSWPSGFSAKDRIESSFSRFASDAPVPRIRLLFDPEAAKWISECEWHSSQKLIKRAGGRLEMSFKATGLLEVLRWTLGWGRHVQVLEPEELRLALHDEVMAMTAARTAASISATKDVSS